MRLLFHAPNVHTGGGMHLMQSLFSQETFPISWAQIDERTQGKELSPPCADVHYVKRSMRSRLLSEWRLWRECRADDLVLCFHGLPPLLPLRGRVMVFVQNRLLIENGSLAGYPLAVRIRIRIERLWSRIFQSHCSGYLVQTPSMAASLKRMLHQKMPVSVIPFAPVISYPKVSRRDISGHNFDFVYVASGDAHKNHRNLMDAWCQLAEAGCRPSLALTIDPSTHSSLCKYISQCAAERGLAVTNLGVLSSEGVDALYRSARAMIYPSKSESLGLPLIEAAQQGLPILASELDFVRDVVEPKETFDPNSPVSIARAVKRFLGAPESPVRIGTAEEFMKEVQR